MIVASPLRVDEPIGLPYIEPMNVAIVVLIVVVGVVALVAAILLVTRTVLRRVTLSSGRMIAENFSEKDIVRSDPAANFFGIASKGGRQVRGNGALVLTSHVLWFRRIGSTQPLEIPLASIEFVDIVRSHAGKSVGQDLLRVGFGGDSAAWYVNDPRSWIDSIRPQ